MRARLNPTGGVRLLPACMALAGCVFLGTTAFGMVNPYESIPARNVFGVKPPAPPAPPPVTLPPAPDIKLQGITTLLNKKTVLFKAKLPAKPPEMPLGKEVSFMLAEGERDGEIEVISVNPKDGTVKFKNYGVEQTLSIKENADKPIALAGAPGAPAPAPAAAPGAAPAATQAAPAATAGSSVTTVGGGPRVIPTSRNTRTATTAAGGTVGGTGASSESQSTQNLSPEVQTILIEANRSAAKTEQDKAKLPQTAITRRLQEEKQQQQ